MEYKRTLKTNDPFPDYAETVQFTDYFHAVSEAVRIRKYVRKYKQSELAKHCKVGMNTIVRFEGATKNGDKYVNYDLLMGYFDYFGLELNLSVKPKVKIAKYVKKQAGGEG